MISPEHYAAAAQLGQLLRVKRWTVATAESCTGGWIGAAITAVPGSSAWYASGFIAYSNEAKQRMLGVEAETLAAHGAVSEAVVAEMARGAAANARAECAIAVSGIAGPAGGSVEKPVGTVCCGWSIAGRTVTEIFHFAGNRDAVRSQSVLMALKRTTELLAV